MWLLVAVPVPFPLGMFQLLSNPASLPLLWSRSGARVLTLHSALLLVALSSTSSSQTPQTPQNSNVSSSGPGGPAALCTSCGTLTPSRAN